jgi:hypothetical protein
MPSNAKRFFLRAVTIAVCALAAVSASAKERPASQLVRSFSAKDARELLTELGSDVKKVNFSADGFTIFAAASPKRQIQFDAMHCTGADLAMTCSEFRIAAHWRLDTPDHAAALAKQLNYAYSGAFTNGADLYLWRMDFIYDGVTREHLHDALGELFRLSQKAEIVMSSTQAPSSPAESTPTCPSAGAPPACS